MTSQDLQERGMNIIAWTIVRVLNCRFRDVILTERKVRQSVMCAGDTTLDFSDITTGLDGVGRRLGFSGTNSTHQCRDWDAISKFAVENRSGDKAGII